MSKNVMWNIKGQRENLRKVLSLCTTLCTTTKNVYDPKLLRRWVLKILSILELSLIHQFSSILKCSVFLGIWVTVFIVLKIFKNGWRLASYGGSKNLPFGQGHSCYFTISYQITISLPFPSINSSSSTNLLFHCTACKTKKGLRN